MRREDKVRRDKLVKTKSNTVTRQPQFDSYEPPRLAPLKPRACPYEHPDNVVCPQCSGFPID